MIKLIRMEATKFLRVVVLISKVVYKLLTANI
mgnify:FL=1